MKCPTRLDLDKHRTIMSEIEEGEIVQDVLDPRVNLLDRMSSNVYQQTAPERFHLCQEITIRIADDSTTLEMYDRWGAPPYTYEMRMIGQQGGKTDLQAYHLETDAYYRVRIEKLQHRENADQETGYVSQEGTNRITDNWRSLEGRSKACSDPTKATLLEKYFKARKRAKDIHGSLKDSLKKLKTVAGDVKEEVVLPEDILYHSVNDLPEDCEESGRMQIEKALDDKVQVPKSSELQWSPISRELDKGKKNREDSQNMDFNDASCSLQESPRCSSSSLSGPTPSESIFPGVLIDPIYASAVLSYNGAFPGSEVGRDVKHGTGASASTNLYWPSELWCGDLKVVAALAVPHLCYSILAYTPSSAKPRVREITRTLPPVLAVQEVSRTTKFDAWPELFQRRPPNEEDIALCFVPWSASIRMGYMDLLDRMIALDHVLMGQVESADILIVPSSQLKLEFHDARGNLKFLWAVFRSKNRPTV